MTEAEWRAWDDPRPLTDWLTGRTTDRKLRLFVAACCREVWDLVEALRDFCGVDGCRVVLRGEGFADSLTTAAEVWAGIVDPGLLLGQCPSTCLLIEVLPALTRSTGFPKRAGYAALFAAKARYWDVLDQARRRRGEGGAGSVASRAEAGDAMRTTVARLSARLREIVGNPFRPAAIDPVCLSWNGGAIPRLAGVAYDARALPSGHLDPVRLAVLADALEEAGCNSADVLAHLRGPGPHVRGCWAVDLVLGKG